MSSLEPIAVRADPPAVLEHPPVHLELRWRPMSLEDTEALLTLLSAIEAVDQSLSRHTSTTVHDMLAGSWKDLEADSLGGFDDTGTLRAYALVEVRPGDVRTVRAFLRGGVHPVWRGRGIGRAVLAWMEGRGRQKLAESGKDVPARLAVFVDESARDQRRLYAAAGFSPIRWYSEMRRDLRAPLPPVEVPENIEVVPWDPEIDDAVRLAHNETFADHWGSEPQTPQTWRGGAPPSVPAWSFAAIDVSRGSGEIAGYAMSSRHEQDWPVRGYSFGYTDVLGVRPAWRGRGLAVVVLTSALRAYRADGMQYGCLAVDTDNPTGAYGIYRRLGYETTHGEVLYSVEI